MSGRVETSPPPHLPWWIYVFHVAGWQRLSVVSEYEETFDPFCQCGAESGWEVSPRVSVVFHLGELMYELCRTDSVQYIFPPSSDYCYYSVCLTSLYSILFLHEWHLEHLLVSFTFITLLTATWTSFRRCTSSNSNNSDNIWQTAVKLLSDKSGSATGKEQIRILLTLPGNSSVFAASPCET